MCNLFECPLVLVDKSQCKAMFIPVFQYSILDVHFTCKQIEYAGTNFPLTDGAGRKRLLVTF